MQIFLQNFYIQALMNLPKNLISFLVQTTLLRMFPRVHIRRKSNFIFGPGSQSPPDFTKRGCQNNFGLEGELMTSAKKNFKIFQHSLYQLI